MHGSTRLCGHFPVSLNDCTRRLMHVCTCNRVYCIHIPGHDPLTFYFLYFILFDWAGIVWPQLSKVLKPVRWAGSVPFPQVSCRSRLFVCCWGRCSCVHLREEPVSSYFSVACCSVVSYWCQWCMFIMLPCSQRALSLVLEHGWFWRFCRGLVAVYIVRVFKC